MATLKERVEELERRVRELEARPATLVPMPYYWPIVAPAIPSPIPYYLPPYTVTC